MNQNMLPLVYKKIRLGEKVVFLLEDGKTEKVPTTDSWDYAKSGYANCLEFKDGTHLSRCYKDVTPKIRKHGELIDLDVSFPDILGRPIEVGDFVSFAKGKKTLHFGKVIGRTKIQLKVEVMITNGKKLKEHYHDFTPSESSHLETDDALLTMFVLSN